MAMQICNSAHGIYYLQYIYVQCVSTLAGEGLVRFTAPAQSGTQHGGGGGYQILLSFKMLVLMRPFVYNLML